MPGNASNSGDLTNTTNIRYMRHIYTLTGRTHRILWLRNFPAKISISHRKCIHKTQNHFRFSVRAYTRIEENSQRFYLIFNLITGKSLMEVGCCLWRTLLKFRSTNFPPFLLLHYFIYKDCLLPQRFINNININPAYTRDRAFRPTWVVGWR